MLVLSRHPKETLVVGNVIYITVVAVDISKLRCRLLVRAPAGCQARTREVFDAAFQPGQEAEKKAALDSSAVITLVDVRSGGGGADGKARLGINVDMHVPVHRLEVYEAIRRENAKAQGSTSEALQIPEGGEIIELNRDQSLVVGPIQW